MFTLLIASAAAYGILNGSLTIQAKPEPIKIPDYSAELGSIKSQVNSISKNLSTLDILKKDIADVQEKLTDMQNKNDQVQQVASSTEKLEILLDKSSYFSMDTIHITAIGAKPQNVVQVRLLDNNGITVIYRQTWADSIGVVMYDLPLSDTTLPSGSYQIKLVSDQQTGSKPITIIKSDQNTSGSPYLFSARTDKTVYQAADLIQVSGTGTPNTLVTTVLTSPSGKTYTSNTTVQSGGTYSTFYSTQSFETGTWYVTVTNLGQSKIIYFTIGSSSSGFTVHTDKMVYQKRDLIQVSGTGASPYTTVNGVLTSPSGNTYSASTTANSDGTYAMSYTTSRSFETGTWYISVTNISQNRIVSIFLEPS